MRRVRPLAMLCPECLALPGEPCLSLDEHRDPEPVPILEAHPARVAAARQATHARQALADYARRRQVNRNVGLIRELSPLLDQAIVAGHDRASPRHLVPRGAAMRHGQRLHARPCMWLPATRTARRPACAPPRDQHRTRLRYGVGLRITSTPSGP
jgi:hypothetical protein